MHSKLFILLSIKTWLHHLKKAKDTELCEHFYLEFRVPRDGEWWGEHKLRQIGLILGGKMCIGVFSWTAVNCIVCVFFPSTREPPALSLIRAIEIGKGVMMVPKECIRMSRHKPGFFIRAWVERIFYSLSILCIGCLTRTDVRKGILPKYDSFPLNWTPPPVFCNYNGEFASKFDLVLIFCVGLRPTHLS